MYLRSLIFVSLCLAGTARAEGTPHGNVELVEHTLSGGWMSEAAYEQGLLAGDPGEGVVWVEYEVEWTSSGIHFDAYFAASDEAAGVKTSYVNEVDLVVGKRFHFASGRWETTLDISILYYDLGIPGIGSSNGDVWGVRVEAEWSTEELGLKPYILAQEFFGIGDSAGNGTVARVGVRGEWGEKAGWAMDVAIGYNDGWFATRMLYAYTYVGPWFDLGHGLTLSIPEVTAIACLDGNENGESLAGIGFSLTKTWGGGD